MRKILALAALLLAITPAAAQFNGGGGSGGGISTLTANSTPTSGYTAGQLLYSDGAKLQALSLNSTLAALFASAPSGSGVLVGSTSPVFVTPILGAATMTSLNKIAISAPTTAETFAFGVDSQTFTFQTGGNIPAWSGAITTGDCVQVATGTAFTISDSGAACGGGGGLTVGTTTTSGGAAGQLMYDTGSVLQESTGITATNNLLTIVGAANAYSETITGNSVTGSGTHGVGLNITGTMNTTGVVNGAALFANITNTASGPESSLVDIQVGGISKFAVGFEGNANVGMFFGDPSNANTPGLAYGAAQTIYFEHNYANIDILFGPSQIKLAHDSVIDWTSSGSAANSPDTGISRIGVGILGIGSGASASVAGSVKLASVIIASTVPTLALSGGTCAGTVIAGGATAGTVTLTGACAATNTMTLSVMPTAPNGYACDANDRTSPTALLTETSTSTTTAVFTFSGTSGATDVIQYKCLAY